MYEIEIMQLFWGTTFQFIFYYICLCEIYHITSEYLKSIFNLNVLHMKLEIADFKIDCIAKTVTPNWELVLKQNYLTMNCAENICCFLS